MLTKSSVSYLLIGLLCVALVACKRDDPPPGKAKSQQLAAKKGREKGKRQRIAPFSEEAFRMMDRNRDGKLGPREISRATRGPWPIKVALEQFERKDKNSAGVLTFDEFSFTPPLPVRPGATAQPHEPPPLEGERLEKFQQAFARADRDGDGKVSREDLWAALPDSQPKWIWQNFSTLDTDGDGFLSLEEFQAAAKRVPAPGPAKERSPAANPE